MDSINITEQEFDLWDSEEQKVVKVKAKRAGSEWKAICPFHDDNNPSLYINEEKRVYFCHGCGKKGILYNKQRIVTTYDHNDENGKLLYQIVRYEHPKGFTHRVKGPDGKWKYSAKGIKKILYKLLELINADKNKPVLFVEGGKDVDNVRALGFESTTYFLVKGQWPEEFNKYFVDRIVILCPDNDDTGRQYSINIGKSLIKVAKDVRWLELPGLKDKEDVSDWIKKGGTAEELKKLASDAPNFSDVVGSIFKDDNYKVSKRDSKLTKPIDKKFNPRQYTELILKKFEIKSDIAGRLWFYNSKEGIWKDNGEDYLKSVIRRDFLIADHIKNYYVSEVIADVKQYLYEGKYFEEPPANLIAFNNKIYDLKNDKYLDFDPKHFFINKILINIDTENRTCPLIDSMFELFVGPDRKIDLYELAAYCLYRKYPIAKFFLLSGDGQNGKSTYINLLEMLLGKENVTSVNLKNISSDRFSTQSLFKKLLSVSVELNNFLFKNTAMLKQLTGRDLIRAEKKFKDDFQFENYAKIVIVANAKITTTDKTVGFSRRTKIINFIAEFEERRNADPFILDKISQAELEGFAHVCLETLKNLYQREFVFSIAQDPEEVKELYDKNAQILNEFLKQKVMLDPESYIPTAEFYEAFTEYLRKLQIAFWSGNMLIEVMESLGHERKQKAIAKDSGKTSRPCWLGIKWIE
ncbi:MAG: hypothetical protein E3J83_00550 [Candidatus Atribacteria bacterium]|nr:MAG: hypothetical protein E3J83_00550 [Candidatus Atribacteria bacterium]